MDLRFPARMWDAQEPRSIIHAAEKAAEAGNHASAEHLLRDAARLQEASLGPRHPDLANTLNNLGIVCEITGKPDDAEQYFRRAVSIARTSLAPDHPFVTTSQTNLREFCEARGKKIELPAPAPAPAPAPEVSKPAPHVTAVIDSEPENPERTSRKLFTRLVLAGLGPIAMLMVVLAAGLPRLGSPEQAAPSTAIELDSPREVVPAPVPAPVDAIPATEETTPPPTATTSSEDADGASPSEITPVSTPVHPVVLRASLCGDLDDWSCDPADRPVPPGPLFFYTQIKSTSGTTVQHRWYQDDRLRQTVKLRVQANQAGGYRTFSRNLMTSDSTGDWRVELRSEDGALLHEERFTVR
jgi:Protein of unknown function (DUF2914)/Tetratricopeptide repeat